MAEPSAGEDLARVARDRLQQWQLTQDGTGHRGHGSLVLPVRTSDGAPATLKIGSSDAESEFEHLALRRWGGAGAVRLLRADPRRHAVLLERLRPRSLHDIADDEACRVIGDLVRRLHVPALPQLRSLTADLDPWARRFDDLPRSAALPRRLIEQAVASTRDLAAQSANAEVLLHGDLHYGNVLEGSREPWLAISPRPVNGDPHAELASMLWRRWNDFGEHVRDGVRTRFHLLVDACGLDEDLARAWTFVRVIDAASRALDGGAAVDSPALTRYVAIAKALQD
ncbi:aminoglycoside phosphotransferase family protein [Mycolicibacterium sp. 050158]|uniref:aminoglycoside phosphotransferase family protein n=1 Tax=Mycolicibacterium sp. 050158 TaxID=3090602 RepID=UPI00299CEAED|nr:aminoglycoside phosphotransferase family protein [Mycolicibacterium sp. 050158]MDX1888828.1 aminoglycoside phosphotransferase family protein [Mycolicibacterium sp. 050158]